MKRKIKAAKTDFTADMLPQSRKAIFFDVLRLQWRKLLLLGMILLFFSLPMLISTLVGSIYTANYISAATESGLDNAVAAAGLVRFELLRSGVNILLFLFFLVGLSGALRVLRQLGWEENVHFPTEFFGGIKSNFGQLAGLGLLCGLVTWLCKAVLYASSGYTNGTVSMVSLLPVAISILLLLPIACLCMGMIPVYANPLGANLKNALYVYVSAPFRVLGTLLVCGLFWIPSVLSNIPCQVLGHVIAFLTLPVTLLGWMLFCFERFDVSINATQCPELIGRGIYRTPDQDKPQE